MSDSLCQSYLFLTVPHLPSTLSNLQFSDHHKLYNASLIFGHALPLLPTCSAHGASADAFPSPRR